MIIAVLSQASETLLENIELILHLLYYIPKRKLLIKLGLSFDSHVRIWYSRALSRLIDLDLDHYCCVVGLGLPKELYSLIF